MARELRGLRGGAREDAHQATYAAPQATIGSRPALTPSRRTERATRALAGSSIPFDISLDKINKRDDMPRRTMISFAIDEDMKTALDEWRDRDGINVSEQLRRAVREWLVQSGKLKGGAKKKTKK